MIVLKPTIGWEISGPQIEETSYPRQDTFTKKESEIEAIFILWRNVTVQSLTKLQISSLFYNLGPALFIACNLFLTSEGKKISYFRAALLCACMHARACVRMRLRVILN